MPGWGVPIYSLGFLVDSDIVATAGHCIKGREECENTAFVFDFGMNARGEVPWSFPVDNVFFCEEILSTWNGLTNDHAVVRIDRRAIGRKPMKVARTNFLWDSCYCDYVLYPGV